MLAYLVIREGAKWSNVFRLIPGRTITIGRAPTNQIVVKDERCSRHHAELFASQDVWTLRDLDSRNGTSIGDQRVHGDYQLSPGEVILIADYQMAFVHDLTKAFSDSNSIPSRHEAIGEETVTGTISGDSNVLELIEPTTITHRRGKTKFLEQREEEDDIAIPKIGRAASKLCRLAFGLASQPDVVSVANFALNGLFDVTSVDAGAVLLAPRKHGKPLESSDLEVIASRTDRKSSYHRVSDFLAHTVLGEGEAVLARNVEGDSTLASRDSKGEITSTSVICAPIRQDGKVVGMIHLYSTDEQIMPDADDLEFTLAVAENVALALKTLGRQQELVENLSQTKSEVDQLRKRLGVESEIVGSSAQMAKVHEEIAQAAPSRATILIRGESGVGKELVARAVHYSSPRKIGPFVCLNCAALTETLLESELFGHERGAFTGATDRKIGKFEAADKGTMMLDEIGEMSPSIQAKFLRVLEGHPFERVGGSQSIKVDARVIAATNRDLEKAVTAGEFRRDLYFRLHVVDILVPPLRRRTDDVVELAEYFLKQFRDETGRKIRGFTTDALEHLKNYRWPGNVRELRNIIERALLLARGQYIDVVDLPLSNLATASESGIVSVSPPAYESLSLDEVEQRHILSTLKSTGWNKSRAAGILGIERSTLDRKIRRYNLKPSVPSHST